MKRATVPQFRRWIRELREACPPLFPVRVRRRSLVDMNGYASLMWGPDGRPDHFIIAIHIDMCEQGTFDTLLHEWAHCITWTDGHRALCDHDALWGVALAHCYGEVAEP